MKLAEKVKEFFHNEGIHSTTIQPEFVEVEVYFTSMIMNINRLFSLTVLYYIFILKYIGN